ncbi:hypothetical protein LINPERPRIM_LOCUS776 [Linum perenne]
MPSYKTISYDSMTTRLDTTLSCQCPNTKRIIKRLIKVQLNEKPNAHQVFDKMHK